MYAELGTQINTLKATKAGSGEWLFSWPRVLVYAGVFGVVVLALQRFLRHVCESWVAFDCPYYWPVSIFEVRLPGPAGIATAVATAIGFFVLYRVVESVRYHLAAVAIAAVLLIAGSTLIQGVDVGVRAPVAGDAQTGVLVPYSQAGQEYWHDAKTVTDAAYFLGHYNEIQPTLHSHAHTHPPGAVLTFYFLSQVFTDPAVIALVLMIFSVTVTIVCCYRLFATEVSDETARYMAFVVGLLPAVQVYYLATIDAVITSLLLAVLYLFCFGRSKWSAVAAGAILTVSLLLTYVSLFIVPVLLGYELIAKRSIRRFAAVAGIVVGAHVLMFVETGYNAWAAFREASHYENPNGPMPLVDTTNYLFTRIEDVAEILFFLGPFLLALFWRGMKRIEFTPLFILTVLAIATLGGMFLVGAWRTGETARACAFIFPFLLFPVAKLVDANPTKNARLQLASLIFAQSLVMQFLGTYHW